MTQSPRIIKLEDHRQTHWTDQETHNASVVVDYLQAIMNDHDFPSVLSRFASSAYVQHNRAIPDGIPGVVGYVKKLAKRFPEFGYDVKFIIASGQKVVTHTHATLKTSHIGDESKGMIITDTFKLEDGNLVEHWDAIQPIDFAGRLLLLLNGGTVANANPIF